MNCAKIANDEVVNDTKVILMDKNSKECIISQATNDEMVLEKNTVCTSGETEIEKTENNSSGIDDSRTGVKNDVVEMEEIENMEFTVDVINVDDINEDIESMVYTSESLGGVEEATMFENKEMNNSSSSATNKTNDGSGICMDNNSFISDRIGNDESDAKGNDRFDNDKNNSKRKMLAENTNLNEVSSLRIEETASDSTHESTDKEETTVFVEFENPEDEYDMNDLLDCKIIGIETDEPIIYLSGKRFGGAWKTYGRSALFFELNSGPDSDETDGSDDSVNSARNLSYVCKTRKVLQMRRMRTRLKNMSADKSSIFITEDMQFPLHSSGSSTDDVTSGSERNHDDNTGNSDNDNV